MDACGWNPVRAMSISGSFTRGVCVCVLPNSPPHIPQLLCVLDTIVPRICSACGRRHVCHRSFPRGVVVRPLGACPRWTMALGGLCAPTLPSYQQLLSYTLLVKEFALLASKRFSTFSGSSRVCAPFGRFIQRREGGDAKSHPRRAIARLRTTRLCLTRGEMEKGSSQLWLPTDFANLSAVASLGIILSRHILVAPSPLQYPRTANASPQMFRSYPCTWARA